MHSRIIKKCIECYSDSSRSPYTSSKPFPSNFSSGKAPTPSSAKTCTLLSTGFPTSIPPLSFSSVSLILPSKSMSTSPSKKSKNKQDSSKSTSGILLRAAPTKKSEPSKTPQPAKPSSSLGSFTLILEWVHFQNPWKASKCLKGKWTKSTSKKSQSKMWFWQKSWRSWPILKHHWRIWTKTTHEVRHNFQRCRLNSMRKWVRRRKRWMKWIICWKNSRKKKFFWGNWLRSRVRRIWGIISGKLTRLKWKWRKKVILRVDLRIMISLLLIFWVYSIVMRNDSFEKIWNRQN